jgi:hypothetical protein
VASIGALVSVSAGVREPATQIVRAVDQVSFEIAPGEFVAITRAVVREEYRYTSSPVWKPYRWHDHRGRRVSGTMQIRNCQLHCMRLAWCSSS